MPAAARLVVSCSVPLIVTGAMELTVLADSVAVKDVASKVDGDAVAAARAVASCPPSGAPRPVAMS